MKKIKLYFAYFLFSLSSLFKCFGKLIITKEKTIMVDALTNPGYFIVDDCMYKIRGIKNGTIWNVFSLSDEYVNDLNKLKQSLK